MSATGLYSALSGAVAEGQALEAVAANLANASTTAFRAQRLGFREVLVRTQGRKEQRFVQTSTITLDTTPGPVRFTGQSTDVALEGPGFLAVQTPAGPRYVRGGSMMRGPDGSLLTLGGHALLGTDGRPLRIPPGAVEFGRRGEVLVEGQLVGRMQIVEFARPETLRGEGSGLFASGPGNVPQAAGRTEVLSRHLEGANVNPLRAMTDVIVTSRHYEALHRLIETYREIDTTAARELATAT
ncbi:MAG: flagellar hook basal-body protein [Myxococcales bacterium]|nr:flagellar hook basal-body protein [Myxococcota bacterium]MDW8283351.1 flagellar hook basal-body protein [Myxococcales bacterium]